MAATIRELVVRATEEALNKGLEERRIQADQIVSIILEPGPGMGTEYWPKYRVIYRV